VKEMQCSHCGTEIGLRYIAERLIGIGEASRILGVNPKTMVRWDTMGILPGIRIGLWRIYEKESIEDLKKYSQGHRIDTRMIQAWMAEQQAY